MDDMDDQRGEANRSSSLCLHEILFLCGRGTIWTIQIKEDHGRLSYIPDIFVAVLFLRACTNEIMNIEQLLLSDPFCKLVTLWRPLFSILMNTMLHTWDNLSSDIFITFFQRVYSLFPFQAEYSESPRSQFKP